NLTPFARDRWRSLVPHILGQILLATLLRRQKGDDLQKCRLVKSVKNGLLREAKAPRLPVIPQAEVIGRICRGEQIEDCQCDAACVDLLENLADSLLWR